MPVFREKVCDDRGHSETQKKYNGHPCRRTRVAEVVISKPNGRRRETYPAIDGTHWATVFFSCSAVNGMVR